MMTVKPVIEAAEAAIKSEIESVGQLAEVAGKFPYYKYVLSLSHGAYLFLQPEADAVVGDLGTMGCGRRISRMSSLRS